MKLSQVYTRWLVRLALDRAGLTHAELAQVMGVSKNTVAWWANGAGRPAEAHLDRLAWLAGFRQSPVQFLDWPRFQDPLAGLEVGR